MSVWVVIWIIRICWTLSIRVVTKIVDGDILVNYLSSSILMERWLLWSFTTIDYWASCGVSHNSICSCTVLKLNILHLRATFYTRSLTIVNSPNWVPLLILNIIIHWINISLITTSSLSVVYSFEIFIWILYMWILLISLLINSLSTSTNKYIWLSLCLENWRLLIPLWFCSILIVRCI